MRESDQTTENIAGYVRASTDKQTAEHQRNDICDWAEAQDIDSKTINWYVDLSQSGTDPGREQFTELIAAIESGEYDRVIIWEVSRLARLGSIYQRFFETAGDNDVIINITNGWTDTVRPDGTGKLIADISAAVAEDQRRRLIKRIESGIRRARSEGKWLGEVPVGFERNDNGYLRPVINPEPGQDSYLEIRAALEAIDNGSSYRKEAKSLDTTRQTLSRIYQDEERRAWYLDGRAEDARVSEALEEIEY